MIRPVFTVACLVMCLSTPLVGQTDEPSADSADVLVLDHDFSASGEIVQVFLNDKQVYRAELSTEDAALRVRPRHRGMKAIRVYPISAQLPSGASVVEFYPDQDGEYEIWAVAIRGSRTATRLRLYRDVSESRRRMTSVRRPGWEVGVEVAGGLHSGFVQSNIAPALASHPSAGIDVEGCLSARSTLKMLRFGLCVLGVSHQSQHGDPSVLWVYTEPRLGVLRRDRDRYSSWETGALFRFGMGIDGPTATAKVFAPGVFLARHLRGSRQGAGWTLQMSYHRAFFKGFSKPSAIGEPMTPKSHRVSFGVGWYK